MDICRYFQQGNCRYGQYCRYEHSFGRFNKVNYNEDEIIAAGVAEEVLNAERGGQWLLSCFGPFSRGPCIPGMEDLSPEEVRWEMYQAEKTGMVQQAKMHFQQLCQDMKTKRDALKNPNRETIAMLKQLEANSSKGVTPANTAGKSSNFSFATPQLGNPGGSASANVFGNKTFGAQSNPFTGGFASSNPATSSSIFGRPNTNTNPVFGGTANFGNNMGAFGSTPNTSSVFGGSTNTQPFGSVASQSSSVFSSTAQPVFGQQSVFGSTTQTSNVFARPQTSQTATSVFDSGATPTNPLFSSPMTSQANPSLFGGPKTTTTGLFNGPGQQQTTNSVFGAPATSGSFFSQPKPAFGGAPVFGSTSTFTSTPNSMFGGTTSTTTNIFGSTSTNTATFGSVTQPGSTFGATATSSAPNVFGPAQTSGPVMSSSAAAPFGTAASTTSGPFVTSAPQFDSTTTTSAAFSKPAFGSPFGATPTSSAPFGSINTSAPAFGSGTTTTSPFTGSTFGEVKNSPFASTNTTTTTTTANPFGPGTQENNSPFGNVTQNQGNNTMVSSSGPFGKPAYGTVMSAIIDDSVYTAEGLLTDDEKNMYLAEKFIFGKIPLKPPTKDIR